MKETTEKLSVVSLTNGKDHKLWQLVNYSDNCANAAVSKQRDNTNTSLSDYLYSFEKAPIVYKWFVKFEAGD